MFIPSCICLSFDFVFLFFFSIKEHELEALNLVCPFCHPLLKRTFREAFAASLQKLPWQPLSFFWMSQYIYVMLHEHWSIQAQAWARLSLGILGVAWQPGSMALVDEGDIKNHVGAGEESLERWCVCVRLQLIRSTSCSQAEFIPAADLYVPSLLELLAFFQTKLYPIIRIRCIVSVFFAHNFQTRS